ncbi:hypothetical protein [Mesorhizobium sp. B1-1-7]|uniref:hypothetical protein n=1 Tax=Mesorhizobium sp. B1-1-7 TaxID=2589977 RepID=UPI00112E6577|nr:hypothetical protein [Mesorhizobium sp. B1-1-7]TPN43198.1 hypothetical protein FJ978_31335 [Mesorhizobium sp. B1-1-7]
MQKNKFAILFLGRQGSSYLAGLIDDHPDATCEGELFAPKVSRIGDIVKGRAVAFCNSRCATPTAYLEKIVNRLPGAAVGFKLPLGAIERHPEIVEGLERFEYKLIRLSRENMLDQYISLKLAAANNKWTSQSGRYRITSVEGNPPEAAQYFDVWQRQNAELARIAGGFPSLHITYERIAADFPAVLDFLGLSSLKPVVSKFKRQREGGQRAVLANYDEMKAHFAGTSRQCDFIE